MIVQVHTDTHIESGPDLTTQVEALVAAALSGREDRVSRVQVHLGDENSGAKAGKADKRCMIEARLDGRAPIAVEAKAATLEQAMNGAAAKLERSLESAFGRLREY